VTKNRLFKKIALFQQQVAYIAEEVGDCQISDTKSFIFNNKIAYFQQQNRLFLTQKRLFVIRLI